MGLAVVMLCLLLVVSVSAITFAASLILGDPLFTPFAQVFGRTDVPVMATDPPGWLGELPEDSPVIGGNLYDYNGQGLPETGPDFLPGLESSLESSLEIFQNIPFYIAEKAQDYLEFHSQNPNKDPETVVWKVNAFLHVPKYSYIRFNNDQAPLLVNPSKRIPYGFSPAVLVPVYDGNPNLLGTPETAEAFRRLRASAIQAGLDLAIVSAYRSAERQRYLWERQGRADGVVARPYHSEHQTGRALDLWGPGPSGLLDAGGGPLSPTGQWVRENAHNYGFIVRYTEENTHITGFISEPWHITYVTLEISQYIHRNNLSSLEEFVARNPEWGLN